MPPRSLPPNTRQRRRSDGSVRLWWEPPAKGRALGFDAVELDADRLTWSAREATRLNRDLAEALAAGGRPARAAVGRTIEALIEDYRRSTIWAGLKPKTRSSYAANFRLILTKWGPQPVAGFDKPVMWTWYQTLSGTAGAYQAVSLIRSMSLLFAHAERIGWRRDNSNPCARLNMSVPKGRRRVAGWVELDALTAAADAAGLPSIALACQLSMLAGQRQTDVIEAELAEFQQASSVWVWLLVRSKRGNSGAIVLHDEIATRLAVAIGNAQAAGRDRLLVDDRTGSAFTEDSFQARWQEVRAAAIAAGAASIGKPILQFRDLRRTFGTMARAGGASKDDAADVLGNSAARNAWLGDVYMAPQLETASRAASAIKRPAKPGRKAG